MSDQVTFGTRLRQLRAAERLSLRDLSTKVNCSPSWLSRLETNEAQPKRDFAEHCDRILNAGGTLANLVPTTSDADRRGRRPGASALPEDTTWFTGRVEELDALYRFLVSPPAGRPPRHVCVVHGMPGVGKTALAVHAARRARSHFAACLFADLRGFTPGSEPAVPGEALDRLLRQAGVPEDEIPTAIDDRSALLRHQLGRRPTLVVLDNAYNAAQVSTMLTTVGESRFIVTSRNRLPALDEAWHLQLTPLSDASAQRLFRSVAGIPTVGEAGAADRIVRWCGGLPLALRVAAARCRTGEVTADELATSLDDRRARLAELDDGERSAVAAFAISYARLPPPARQVFAAVGLHPGEDVDRFAAAALAGLSVRVTEHALQRLTRANLLTRSQAGRHRPHDLIREFARAQAEVTLSHQARHDARVRLVNYYLCAAAIADRVITPHRHPIRLAITAPPAELPDLNRYDRAVSWLETEQHNLVAACRAAADGGLDIGCWQLAYTLRGYFFLAKRWDAWTSTHQWALAAARRGRDRWAEAAISNNLGLALLERGDVSGAAVHYRDAMRLFHQLGDVHGVSTALGNYSWVHHRRGNPLAALRAGRRAYARYRQDGSRRNSAITLRGMASCEIDLGLYQEAINHLNAALRIFAQLDLQLDRAMALNLLGEAHRRTGNAVLALAYSRRALEAGRGCGSRYEETLARQRIGALTRRA